MDNNLHLKINKIRLGAKIETEHLQITNKLTLKNSLSKNSSQAASEKNFSARSGSTEMFGKSTLNQIDEQDEREDETQE